MLIKVHKAGVQENMWVSALDFVPTLCVRVTNTLKLCE